MYPDLLNMYGDIGNISILKYRAEKRGIDVHHHSVSAGESADFAMFDIILLGGGQDFEMGIVYEDLSGEKKERLRAFIENEGVFLAIGSGFQLLGETYVSGEGELRDGLQILPVVTKPYEGRFVGNIASEINGVICVGFENHAGRTYIGGATPLGKTLCGFGNNGEDGGEGLLYKNTICSFLHGPLLSKNPELADDILLRALSRKYGEVSLESLDDTLELSARESVLKKMKL